MQGMSLDNTELRETTHDMLAHFARLLGADFAPWLPQAVASRPGILLTGELKAFASLLFPPYACSLLCGPCFLGRRCLGSRPLLDVPV